MSKDEIKTQTNQLMFGKWSYVSKELEIDIVITKDKITVRKKENGVELPPKSFLTRSSWDGNYLRFHGEKQYYIVSATKKYLIFGENENGILNQKIWEVKLEKVK